MTIILQQLLYCDYLPESCANGMISAHSQFITMQNQKPLQIFLFLSDPVTVVFLLSSKNDHVKNI